MRNHRARFTLFLSSYSPLVAILAIRAWPTNRSLSVLLACLALVSVLFLWLFVKATRGIAPEMIRVTSVSSMASETLSYVVTYLFPFLDIDYADPVGLLSVGLLFVVLSVIYVRANLIHVNPLLLMTGVHVFRVSTESGKELALLTRREHVPIGARLRVVPLGNYVSMEKPHD